MQTTLSIPMADETVKKIFDKVKIVVRDNRLRKKVAPDAALYILDQSHIMADLANKTYDECEDNHLVKMKPETEPKRGRHGNAHIIY
jgi:hypothetical protein